MRAVILDGKQYRSIVEAAKVVGMHSQHLHRALQRGWKVKGLEVKLADLATSPQEIQHSDKEGI